MTETTAQTVDQKLTDPAFFADEDRFYDLFAQLRRNDPVHWTVGPDGRGLWSVFKHADVKKILNDTALFSSEREGDMPIFNSDVEIVAGPLDIDVHYIQGGGTYLFGGNAARPFLAATIGASHFEPGLGGVDSETFFAFSIGAGLQIRPNERFGMRLEARGYGTLLSSESDLFCQSGPAGVICAIRVEGNILWQWHAFAGFTFRF